MRSDNRFRTRNNLKTKHRYGFTGTLPESKIDQWNIIGKIGPVIYELSRDEMVKNKFITDAEIRVVYFNYKYKTDYDSVDSDDMLAKYELELSFIKNNKFRNETIKTICSKLNKNLIVSFLNLLFFIKLNSNSYRAIS